MSSETVWPALTVTSGPWRRSAAAAWIGSHRRSASAPNNRSDHRRFSERMRAMAIPSLMAASSALYSRTLPHGSVGFGHLRGCGEFSERGLRLSLPSAQRHVRTQGKSQPASAGSQERGGATDHAAPSLLFAFDRDLAGAAADFDLVAVRRGRVVRRFQADRAAHRAEPLIIERQFARTTADLDSRRHARWPPDSQLARAARDADPDGSGRPGQL